MLINIYKSKFVQDNHMLTIININITNFVLNLE